jgi:hypothetical protein
MTPKVTLRKALEDPELLGSALAGPTWHAWRSLLLAGMGEPLNSGPSINFVTSTIKRAANFRSPNGVTGWLRQISPAVHVGTFSPARWLDW